MVNSYSARVSFFIKFLSIQETGSSQRGEQLVRDCTWAPVVDLQALYEIEAVKTPFHAMCVWLHSMMVENRFACQVCALNNHVFDNIKTTTNRARSEINIFTHLISRIYLQI